MKDTRKKRGAVVALMLCLALVGVGGVMAWYSTQSHLTNTFTQGNITQPDTDPDKKPINPDLPPDQGGHQGQVSGNIVENKWMPDSKIAPGSKIPKNPNVGIGETSDDAYVFVYVDNNFTSGVHFTLKSGWKPVADSALSYKGDPSEYTGGLFVYTGTNPGDAPALLEHDPAGVDDMYTGEVFDSVTADVDAVLGANTTIDVHAYLVGASYAGEDMDAAMNDIVQGAKDWAAGIK